MTYTFHVGEPSTTRADGVWAIEPPAAVATAGPGGLQILVALEAPSEAERLAVESGPVALGVSDGADAAAILVRIGTPGHPGCVEVSAASDVGEAWWGADVELGLCDAGGVVRAVRRFQGVEAPAVAGR